MVAHRSFLGVILLSSTLLLSTPVYAGVEPAAILSEPAIATPAQTNSVVNPGILPSSGLAYWFKVEGEAIILFFTHKPNDRMRYFQHIAQLRLAEAWALSEAGEINRINPTLLRYTDTLKEIQRLVDERHADLDPLQVKITLAELLVNTDSTFIKILPSVAPTDRAQLLALQDQSDQTAQNILEVSYNHGFNSGKDDSPGIFLNTAARGKESIPTNPILESADQLTPAEYSAAEQLDEQTAGGYAPSPSLIRHADFPAK